MAWTRAGASASPQSAQRLRLLSATLVWIGASIVVAGWGLSNLFHRHVEAQFHAELQTHIDQLTAHLTLDARGLPVLALPLSDPRLRRPYSGCYWQIERIEEDHRRATTGVGLLRSRSLWGHVLTMPADTPADGELHRHRLTGPEGRCLA